MAVYPVSLPPHIRDTESASKMLWKTSAALLPAFIVLSFVSKFEVFKSLGVSIAAALFAEALAAAWFRKKNLFRDFSGFLEALVFTFLISPNLSYGAIFAGFFFGVFAGREIFGGAGSGFFSPALLAFAFLQVSFPEISAASPFLSHPVVSALIFLGGLFLIWQKLIPWQVPACFLAAFLAISFLAGSAALFVFPGEILFAAFFLVTDSAVMPLAKAGRILFALAAALLLIFFRALGNEFDPLTFSLLSAGLLAPWLDRFLKPRVLKTHV
jgi:Na+-translocating ferredoxin:NAD+ oxidoreductase subunit D